jgi:hypothetical protein
MCAAASANTRRGSGGWRHPANGLGEQAPEEEVHSADEGGDVEASVGSGLLLQPADGNHDTGGGLRVDLILVFGESGIGEGGFMPGAACSEVARKAIRTSDAAFSRRSKRISLSRTLSIKANRIWRLERTCW